jgi:hypothetical protein
MPTSGKDLLEHHVTQEVQEYGYVRPPWHYMDEHPCSIGWRMGGGEWHLMMFEAWWERLAPDEATRIEWVRRWNPVPLWYPWCARLIWPGPWEDIDEDEDEKADETAVERLSALGIGSVREWQEAEQKALEALDASPEEPAPKTA